MSEPKFKGTYPESEHFKVIDSISVPHQYCITPRHIAYASDHHSGILDKAAMEGAEGLGVKCGVPGCQLLLADHEQALLIECTAAMDGDDGKANPELHKLLLEIKDEATANGYAGFAFLDKRKEN